MIASLLAPVYDSGYLIMLPSFIDTPQTQSFTTIFPQPPEVGLAYLKTIVSQGAGQSSLHQGIGIGTILATSFTYLFTCTFANFQTATIQWFAIISDDVHFEIAGFNANGLVSKTLNFGVSQAITPNAVFFLNRFRVQTDGVSVSPPQAGITITLPDQSVLKYFVDVVYGTIIYGNPIYLKAGYQSSASAISPYPMAFTNYQLSAECINTFLVLIPSTAQNAIEIVRSNPNNLLITMTSTELTIPSEYSFTYFMYQICAPYCTSCTVGCDSCLASTQRSNPPDCLTCPQYMYASAMSIDIFIECSAYCNNCLYEASNCTACMAGSGRTNPPLCLYNQCQLVSQYIAQGQMTCQICNNYCDGCAQEATQCLVCLASTSRLTPPLCSTCPTQMFLQVSVTNCQCICISLKKHAPHIVTTVKTLLQIVLHVKLQLRDYNHQIALPVHLICTFQQVRIIANNAIRFAINALFRLIIVLVVMDFIEQMHQIVINVHNLIIISILPQMIANFVNHIAMDVQHPQIIVLLVGPLKSQVYQVLAQHVLCEFILPASLCSLDLTTHVCSQNYNRDSSCNCLAGFYNSETSLSCPKCSSTCQTCTNSATNCFTCNTSLFLQQPPACNVCMDGYFMHYGTCTLCSNICTTCINSKQTCSSCAAPRQDPPLCSCPLGYFNECKQTCGFQCNSCTDSSANCLTCAGNRINPPICGCPDGSVQQSQICSLCSLVQPNARFSDDLTAINIVFLYKFLIQVTCEALLHEQTLVIIGISPQCTVNVNIITITLGTNATITVNSPIFINPDALQFANCNQTIFKIITPKVQLPFKIYAPSITFNEENYSANQCDVLMINIIESKYSGSRNLNVIGWSVLSASNNLALGPLINKWNSSEIQNSYVLMPENLRGQSSIQLLITYSNFIGLVSSSRIRISIQDESLQITIQVPKQVYVFDIVQVIFSASVQRCDLQIPNEAISLQVIITNSSTSLTHNYSIQSGAQGILTYHPFTLSQFSTYYVNAIAQYKTQNITVQKQFQVVTSDIIVNVLGGDQIIGINQQMKLEAVIFNPNNQSSVNDLTPYKTTWQCFDITTIQKCANFTSDAFIAYINTSNSRPFTSLYLSIEVYDIISSQQVSKHNITVKVLENEVTQVKIVGNQYLLNLPMNIYDQADVTIYYQTQMKIDIDNLTYYASYLDASYQLNQIQFYSPYTSIILENFRYLKNAKYQVMVYHPEQKGPSVATLNIRINIPPQQCKLSIFTRGAKFQVSINQCISQSQPLFYKFLYYTTTDEFIQDSKNGLITNGIKLSEYQTQATFLTYLYGQNTSLIVGLIKDSSNGISNISFSLEKYQTLDPNIFVYMLRDEEQNLPRNIMFILKYSQVNNQIISDKYYDEILRISDTFNQTDKKTQYIQQQLAFQRSVSNKQISTSLINTNCFINNISSQITFLQNQQNDNKYNKNYQIQMIQLESSLSDCTNKISFLYEQSQLVQNRRMLETQGQNITQSITSAISDVTDILGKLTKLNQNQKVINTPQFNLTAQKFSTMNINENFKLQIINQTNQSVSYKNQNFTINPYQNDTTFTNPVKAPLIIPNLTGSNNVQITPANPVPFNFPPLGDIEVSCASKVGDIWSMELCTIVKSSITLQCLCQTLSPLSIVQALQFILGEFGNLFKNTILSKIRSFSYEQSLFTYIIAIFITLYLVSMVCFFIKDKIDNSRIHPVINSGIQFEENYNLNMPPSSRAPMSMNVIIDSDLTTTADLLYTKTSILGQLKSSQITKISGFTIFLQNSHVFLELYYRYDEQEPRVLRLSILFLQIVGQICIFVLFGKNLAISIVIGLSIFQTAYGIFFQLILSHMIKSKNRIAHSLGIFTAALLTGLCTYLIIAAMALFSSPYYSNIAAISYLGSFCVDYFVSNVLVELAKYVFVLKTFDQEKFYVKISSNIEKIHNQILPKSLQEILFGRIVFKTKTKTQS